MCVLRDLCYVTCCICRRESVREEMIESLDWMKLRTSIRMQRERERERERGGRKVKGWGNKDCPVDLFYNSTSGEVTDLERLNPLWQTQYIMSPHPPNYPQIQPPFSLHYLCILLPGVSPLAHICHRLLFWSVHILTNTRSSSTAQYLILITPLDFFPFWQQSHDLTATFLFSCFHPTPI